jgi:protocatechuate 3,4-dioxygenase beta subunit
MLLSTIRTTELSCWPSTNSLSEDHPMRKLVSVATIVVFVLSQCYQQSLCIAQTQKEPGSVTGQVKIDGKPARGIAVIATPSVTDAARIVEGMFNPPASVKATTDSEGVYKLEGVPPGKYRVAPSAPELVSAGASRTDDITVSEGATVEGVDFVLSLGGVITGRITDIDGRPVIGQRISLKPLHKTDPQGPGAEMMTLTDRMYSTDDRGIYRIFGLRPGRYLVSAGKDSDVMSAFLSQRPKRVQTYYPSVTEEAKARPVQVSAGSEASGVDIQFSGTDKGFVVSGRVLDSESKTPIANAMVAYSKARNERTAETDTWIKTDTGTEISGMPGGFTTTNDKGEFRFAAVSPGNYKLDATSIGALAGAGGSHFYADPVTFEVLSTNVDRLEIKVHRGGGISGLVVIESSDSQDSLDRYGQLVLIAMVTDSATNSYSSGNCMVAPDGSFRLGGLKPGKVTLRTFSMSARRPGILRIERNGAEVEGGFEIQANEDISGLRVILTPAIAVIRGRVTFQGGSLQPGAKVTALARPVNADRSDLAGIGENQSAEVNPDGSFLIENLTPGTYEVQVSVWLPAQQGSRSVSAKQIVTAASDGPAEVEIVVDLGKASDK